MPHHVQDLHDFIQSTWRWCTFLSGWFCGLILRPYTELLQIGSPFRSSLSGYRKRGACHTTFLPAMNPIDISSSDTDWGLEDDSEGDTSPISGSSAAVSRILPSWAATTSTNSGYEDYDEPFQLQRASSSKRVSTFNNRPSIIHHPTQDRLVIHSNFSDANAGSNHRFAQGHDSSYYRMNGKVSQPSNFVDVENLDEGLNSKDLLVSGKDIGNFLPHQAPKRTLPPSLQPSMSHVKLNQFVGNVSGNQIRDAFGKSPLSSGASLANYRTYMKDHLSSGSDDMLALDSTANRILPLSLLHGKSGSTSQLVGPSDLYHSGTSEERAAEHDERLVFQAALQDLHQPKIEATLPVGLLSVSLFRHQKIALHWMLQKETRSTHCSGGILADDQGLGKTISMISLIQMQRSLQSKFKEGDQTNHKTEALNLDDDDDNGDAGLDKAKKNTVSDNTKATPETGASLQTFRRRRPAAGTLVVCPATVLRQWARELSEKVTDEAKLSVLIYHGGNRTKDPVLLAKYDVVLTTYSIVTNEVPKQPLVDEDDVDQRDGENYGLSSDFSVHKKRKRMSNGMKRGKKGRKEIDASSFDCDSGTLAKVGWFRVILDEAQTIKNHRTQVSRACCGLRAKRRWCLSGTPIQNAVDDLYSYFRFLKLEPYCVYKSFCNSLKHPISRNSARGYMKLQAVLTPIMLRRTKDTKLDGEPIINLPPKLIRLSKVDFSTEERAFYKKLEAETRSKFKAYAAAGTVNQNYANILLMLLRLRQACDHPLLVKGFNSDSVRKVSVDMAKKLPKDMLDDLLSCLETSLAICCICSDPPEDAVVTMCRHVFCYQCIAECLTGDDNTCRAPECKEQLGVDVIFSEATLRSCIDGLAIESSKSSQFDENSLVLENEYSSSKIRAAIEILQLHCKAESLSPQQQSSTKCNGNPSSPNGTAENHISEHSVSRTEGPAKAIIFSQWTSMLDLVEISLNQYCIQYRRLDGTMTLIARDRAVKDFNSDPEVTVLLMSLKAGNLGLNMVAASHVILLDLWWNPTTEDQAIDRAHRIGQTRTVTVSRITIKDTVEDRILLLQEEKRKMVASAFGDDPSGGSKARLTVEDLNYLFMASGNA